jgi:hypothetical protein
MEIKEMTKTTDTLLTEANKIEDWFARKPLIDIIMGGQENANDTFGTQKVSEEEREALAWASMEGLLCEQDDQTVNAWFKAQGVSW